jgi:hypothetical protein
MKEKCILIKTKDNRKFFTQESNLISILEYVKTFKAEVELVEVEKGTKILELKGLTVALCDPNFKSDLQYEKIKDLYPSKKKERQSMLVEAKTIRDFIRTDFVSGRTVSLKEVKAKYHKHNLTDACLCNHITVVRRQLMKEGFEFQKIGAGEYRIAQK